MKKAQVKIDGKYYATVTNKKVEVQITGVNPNGGWDATNLATGKKIHIKDAERLEGEVKVRKPRAKGVKEATVEVAQTAASKKERKAKAAEPTTDTFEKKLSCVTAALKVLGESIEPMNTVQMIEAMASKGYWTSPGGKTPHATLYSAILRDLDKGDESRFVKTEPGRFTVRAGV